MSVLIYVENNNNKFKKSAFELATYGSKLAAQMGTECIALVFNGNDNVGELGQYGVSKVLNLNHANLMEFDSMVSANAIKSVADQVSANIVILANSSTGKSLVGRLGVLMNAGVVSGVTEMANTTNGFELKKGVYSGKGIVTFNIKSDNKVFSLMSSSIGVELSGAACPVEDISVEIMESKTKVISKSSIEGTIPLPEAELVVSAGRGMKGPENWDIIEDLAAKLGATTACSRPVADSDWRPHHEHVGQTGVAIRPNLYIAIGISGAIQHLAGVNNSKTIVVINKDPEAPFFKAADYGICADLFDVVPKLTAAIEKFKSNS